MGTSVTAAMAKPAAPFTTSLRVPSPPQAYSRTSLPLRTASLAMRRASPCRWV